MTTSPLDRRVCEAVVELTRGRNHSWTTINAVASLLRITDMDELFAAIHKAEAARCLITSGGERPHSISLGPDWRPDGAWRSRMTHEERHNKPDQTTKEKKETQGQREHHKPDHGKDEREVVNEKAKKPE